MPPYPTIRILASVATAIGVGSVLLLITSNASRNVDGVYKIVKSVPRLDPPLHESTVYTVVNQQGVKGTRHSTEYEWPQNLPVGTIVEIKNGDMTINGKPDRSPLEKFFLWTIFKITAGLGIPTALFLWVLVARHHIKVNSYVPSKK